VSDAASNPPNTVTGSVETEFTRLVKHLKQVQPKELSTKLVSLAMSLGEDDPDGEWVGLKRAPAGRRRHHHKEGGLVVHTNQMIEFCLSLYHERPAPFKTVLNPSDIIVACFLHDIHKAHRCFRDSPDARETELPFEYLPDHERYLPDDIQTLALAANAGITLTKQQTNAIICAEAGYGRFGDMDRSKLAVIISMADDYSAFVLKK